ncbi:MAG: class I SAM-dependent methyltransferase [Arenicellales bacterium]|jgi:SAM-dependent methyltransferase|nr:SAM-dependent methyltransferase [Acidiferrobacteraceae bacterium]MDP6140996.1 class I SAM-dependent methyltransferase [Arenicellales bacterium]HCV21278.1 SAM-dependent methyltransferase [Gammaproteobacteria bacterium]MDP6312824.1 class I SAM-dependent methyltransferase [Arenicellales bacterium]MDP7193565.1 class I SAM-dependent methyltransferase [Arenicellales bacterium]|tara:strand:+ start:623 stop:1462 length:840 start_codon:yes stop_codon:yes gene_type:complete
MSPQQSKPRYRKRTGKSQADQADRHLLYQEAVQCVEAEIDMVDNTFRTLRGRRARTLREDFCGTANTSTEWVQRRKTNQAYAVDLDSEVLNWGRNNNVAALNGTIAKRITLLNDNVLTAQTPPVDLILAMNFSYQIFKTRDDLRCYFSRVRECLVDDGVFFIDTYGGYEAFREMEEETEHDNFTYVWDQARYNPITGDMVCYIHFKFPDGSRMKRAFTYTWRLWTLPELRELLMESGFQRVLVHWEGTDEKTGEGNDIYTPTEIGEADAAHISYISAEK